MLKLDMIPDEVVAALQRAHGFHISPQALATALNAWPGVGIEVARDESEAILLPLPLKDVQNDVHEPASRPLK